MSTTDAAVRTLHLLFAATWAGSVLFVTVGVLPVARDGDLKTASGLRTIAGRLTWISRISAVVLLLTGGHMAATGYTAATLTGTTRGHLVLAMLVLWLVLAGLVEVGNSKLSDGLRQRKIRTPAQDYLPIFQAASIVAVLLLIDAGVLSTGLVG